MFDMYQGALLNFLNVLDWNVWWILVLEGLLYPHVPIPQVQTGLIIVLYKVILFSRDSCDFLFISQFVFLTLSSNGLLFSFYMCLPWWIYKNGSRLTWIFISYQRNKTLIVVDGWNTFLTYWLMPTTAQEFMCNIMTASFIMPLAKRFAKRGPGVGDRSLYCIIMWCPLTPKFTTQVTFSWEIMKTDQNTSTSNHCHIKKFVPYLPESKTTVNPTKSPLPPVRNKPAHKMWVYALTSWRYCNKQCAMWKITLFKTY
jgi:hypothetical protein